MNHFNTQGSTQTNMWSRDEVDESRLVLLDDGTDGLKCEQMRCGYGIPAVITNSPA